MKILEEARHETLRHVTRRHFLRTCTTGLGAMALASLSGCGPVTETSARRAVQRDGLSRVIFRRDSKDPDQVIRLEVDFGVDDGEWIVVKTELTDGDEIVVSMMDALSTEKTSSRSSTNARRATNPP